MLEQQMLSLEPWVCLSARSRVRAVARAGHFDIRNILNPVNEISLGFARRGAGAGSWWRRLVGPVFTVHETDDESLLFTVHRLWNLTPHWEVRDADGRRVGSFTGRSLHDRVGRLWAVVDRGPDNTIVCFRSLSRANLAILTRSANSVQVTFADDLEGGPFAKMIMLAAVLTDSPTPHAGP